MQSSLELLSKSEPQSFETPYMWSCRSRGMRKVHGRVCRGNFEKLTHAFAEGRDGLNAMGYGSAIRVARRRLVPHQASCPMWLEVVPGNYSVDIRNPRGRIFWKGEDSDTVVMQRP